MMDSLNDLSSIKYPPKSGSEVFHLNGVPLDVKVIDFWRWSVSDLLSNATRGRLAEFIVAYALGIPFTTIRDEWSAWDLTTPEGIKIEVKSAAYCQSWYQKSLSKITFLVPKTRVYDAETNKQSEISRRQADVYVFALLAHQEKLTVDPLDVSQWEFYVLPTYKLDQRKRSQHSIHLNTLQKYAKSLSFYDIREAVVAAHADQATAHIDETI